MTEIISIKNIYNIYDKYDIYMFFEHDKFETKITYNIMDLGKRKFVFDDNVCFISPVREDMIILEYEENKFIYMDKNLKKYIPKNNLKYYLKASYFNEQGIAAVCDDTGYYHINKNLEPLYNERYDKVYNFRNKFAIAYKDGKAFHINKEGKPIYEYRYDHVEDFVNGYAIAKLDNKYFHIHPCGIPAYEERFDYLENFDEGALAYCKKGAHHCFIDTCGRIIYKSHSYHSLLGKRYDKKPMSKRGLSL